MKQSKWKSFLGGSDLAYTLAVVIMAGLLILILSQLNFIFDPIVTILSSILLPFVLSILLYYLMNPLVDFMERHKINRIWGVVILYIVLAVLLVGIIAILIPVLQDQVVSFINNFPTFVNDIIDAVINFVNSNIPNQQIQDMVAQVESFVTNSLSNITDYITQGLSGVTTVITGITSAVVTIVTVPIILFFLLKDDRKMFNGFIRAMPPKWRPDVLRVSHKINTQVGSYIKGQLTVAVVNGVMMYLGFTLIGLNYSGILGIAGGFFSIIPYLGAALTFIPAVIVALFDSFTRVLLLVAVWAVVQFVEGNFIEPNVMGRQLKVHPLTIIVVLIILGDLLGIIGLIFGIPIYAIIKVLVVHVFNKTKLRYNAHYGEVAGEYNVERMEQYDFGDDNIEVAQTQFIDDLVKKEQDENEKNDDNHSKDDSQDEDENTN